METAETIASLYRESTAGDDPDPAFVAQLLDILQPGEEVLFTCGWPDNGEKWGPIAQLTVTSRRILDQRTLGAGVCAPVRAIALDDVAEASTRARRRPDVHDARARRSPRERGARRLGAPHQRPGRAGRRGDRRRSVRSITQRVRRQG